MNDPTALEKKVRFRVRDLDTMPFVFRKLMAMLNKPYPSARELGQVIATDQGLSVKVLRMANSAAGGVRSQVLSVHQAVSLLGINVVRSLSFCMASYDSFFSSNDPERKGMWRHSLLTALVARDLSVFLRLGQPEEMFVAGMLHDVGHSVIIKHCPKEYARMQVLMSRGKETLEAEQEVLGVGHAEVGAWACDCWRMSALLCNCVRFHHQPEKAPSEYRMLAYLIHLADAWALQAVDPGNIELELFQPDCLALLKVTPEKMTELSSQAILQLEEIERFLSSHNATRAS
ncbi:HDOD domain-containing protein [bacterium]|nr:HDOD domain-containing protein [bacterium]